MYFPMCLYSLITVLLRHNKLIRSQRESVFQPEKAQKMAASTISPQKAAQIAKKASETVLTHTGQVLIQANTPELLPGLTGQNVVDLWPTWRAGLEKRARNTDPRHHKTLVEQAMQLLYIPVHSHRYIDTTLTYI